VVKSTIEPAKLTLSGGIGVGKIIALVVMYVASFSVGQEAVQRYYAAKDEKSAVKGSLIAAVVYILFAFIPAIIGLATKAMVSKGIIDGSVILTNGARYALPTLAMQIMPPILVGLLFAGLISATMSSADSDLLGAGSIFSNDIYKVYINKDADDKKVLRVTQGTMILIGLLSMIVALTNTKSIITVLMFSFTLRAGGAFIPYVVGHYWKRANWSGALLSVIFGSLVVILVEKNVFSFFGLDPIFPGLLVSLIVFVGCGYIFKNAKSEQKMEG